MDADGTHPAETVYSMKQKIDQGADIVVASRFAEGGAEFGVPLFRRFLSRGAGLLLKMAFGIKGTSDLTSGFRAFSGRRVL